MNTALSLIFFNNSDLAVTSMTASEDSLDALFHIVIMLSYASDGENEIRPEKSPKDPTGNLGLHVASLGLNRGL